MSARNILLVICAFVVSAQTSVLAIDQKSSSVINDNPALKQPGWLGVWVRPLSAPLKSQLSTLTPSGEGLMVERVESGSPAAQAGIRPYDVLLSFNGQKLYSSEQLSSLVHYSNAGSEVEMSIIQQGEIKTLTPRLAAGKSRTLARTNRQPPQVPFRHPYQQPVPPLNKIPDSSTAWDMFETVEVKTLADGRYRAIVSYKDKSDDIKTFTFEGEKHEIIEQIEQLKELPENKKQALLQALNLKPGRLFGLKPFGFSDDFFNHPLFNQSPFNQPFFQDPYSRDRFNIDPWRGSPPPPPWQFHIYPDSPGWNQ